VSLSHNLASCSINFPHTPNPPGTMPSSLRADCIGYLPEGQGRYLRRKGNVHALKDVRGLLDYAWGGWHM
jgi:hypothetical protein